jgi:hypothetical protein
MPIPTRGAEINLNIASSGKFSSDRVISHMLPRFGTRTLSCRKKTWAGEAPSSLLALHQG